MAGYFFHWKLCHAFRLHLHTTAVSKYKEISRGFYFQVAVFHMCMVVAPSSNRKQRVPFVVLCILGPNLTDLTPSAERILVRVIDPFTIKPLDIKTIMDHTRATRGRILTVEDHYHEGGFLLLSTYYITRQPDEQPGLCHWPVTLGVLRWRISIGSTAKAPCGGSCRMADETPSVASPLLEARYWHRGAFCKCKSQ